MCGQAGIIFNGQKRTEEEYKDLQKIFVSLLLLNETRGGFATGVATVQSDGSASICKAPLGAPDFIKSESARKVIGRVEDGTTIIMGHTRFPTQGSEFFNCNNHPIRSGTVIGTHNGSVVNSESLFKGSPKLERSADVDSEVLFSLASAATKGGQIDLERYATALGECQGSITSVLVTRTNPWSRVIVKRSTPLSIRRNDKLGVLVYTSEHRHLNAIVPISKDWVTVQVSESRVISYNRELKVSKSVYLATTYGRSYSRHGDSFHSTGNYSSKKYKVHDRRGKAKQAALAQTKTHDKKSYVSDQFSEANDAACAECEGQRVEGSGQPSKDEGSTALVPIPPVNHASAMEDIDKLLDESTSPKRPVAEYQDDSWSGVSREIM